MRTATVAAIVASMVTAVPAAAIVANAHKVDGKHAVSSSATTNARKGKLVATNATTGRLPNNIVAKAPDADRLDGLDSSQLRVGAESTSGALTTISGCGSAVVASRAITLQRASSIFVSVSSEVYLGSTALQATIRAMLHDEAGDLVASTWRDKTNQTTGEPVVSVADLMRGTGAGTAYKAPPGRYTLSIDLSNFGSCGAGSAQYVSPILSHLTVPVG